MATAAVPSSNLFDLVQCELCLKKYNDSDRLPKLLKCSHTFCLACMQIYYESKLKKKLPCPNCKTYFRVPRGEVQKLKTNTVVLNLLDHLAPFTLNDTDEGVAEGNVAPKIKILEESGSTMCGLHPGEKCDFYCDDCSDPLCADCIVSLSEGPHKTHKILKLRDVLTTQHAEALQIVIRVNVECKQRTEELLNKLVLSRDSLMKEAKSKRDKAHQEADRWYQNTTATIAKVYDQLHAQILRIISKSDLQELHRYLTKINFQNIDGNSKESQRILGLLQMCGNSFKKSTVWPTKFWSVDVGKITDNFTVDLGRITEPTLNLPDVNSFPFIIEPVFENTEVAQPDMNKETRIQPGFRLLSDLPMEYGCKFRVGLTTNEAVVCFEDQSIIKQISFDRNKIITLKQSALPHDISIWCMKYKLNNNNVLLRERHNGPTYILNSQLELVSTIVEDYGTIIGAECTQWVAFCSKSNKTTKAKRLIWIYDLEQKQLIQTLRSAIGVKWLEPSICRHPDSQAIAVVNGYRCSLCVYDHDGRHLHTHKLKFLPRSFQAIACNRRHLYVVSQRPVSVCLFLWSGQLVTVLDTQQLNIPDGQKIGNIAVGDDQFTILVGGPGVENSFKTFQCV